MTIGRLADAAGVPSSTVRYYERTGLLRPVARSASGYRLYSEAELERLRFIRAAQATGFTLADVRELLRPTSCRRVQGLLEARLEAVAEHLAELRRVKRVLRGALRLCREHEERGRCGAVDSLARAARRRQGASRA